MAYPKPLSVKSLERMYRQSGMTEEQMEFLRKFVLACANLYGAFLAKEGWAVYKELAEKTDVVKIQRKNLYDMLAIMRREPDRPFYVLEIDEVYRDEKPKPGDMVVVNRGLVMENRYKYRFVPDVLDNSYGKPFFVPENLLDYVEMPEEPHEAKLLHVLENLRSTEEMATDPITERKWKCKYTGKKLKDFCFVSDHDEFNMEWEEGKYGKKPDPKLLAKIKEKIYSVNAAQRLVNDLKWWHNIGNDHMNWSIREMIEHLMEMGVDVEHMEGTDYLLQLTVEMMNHQHVWCNHGWAPSDLMEQSGPIRDPIISIGPGLRRAFEEGLIDPEEYLGKLREAGFEVEFGDDDEDEW